MSYQENTYWEGRYRQGGNSGQALETEHDFLVDHVKRDVDRHSVQSVLDVGVGDGRLAQKIVKAIPDVAYTGLDIAPTGLAFASKRLPSTVKLVAADIVENPVDPHDMVLCFNVHYHMATIERANALIRNVVSSATKVAMFLTWNNRVLQRGALSGHNFYRPFLVPGDAQSRIRRVDVHDLPAESQHKTLYVLSLK